MRLLEVGRRGKLTFTKDLIHGKDVIPPYAILSHTWESDPDDEVTYTKAKKRKGKRKAGYQKILFCAEQSNRDGLKHFWVDTCCIDKTNAAELTESINSMFRWYQKAEKCYVFLSDVSCNRLQKHGPLQLSWKQQLQSSKWFTRGWTLQELLSPPIVQFFSSDNQLLGDKHSLAQEIHEITGIPIHALNGASLSSFSVDERISWSQGRTTSREEDKAYSLLGILSVSMPVIYGEGEIEAFNRLLAEVSRRTALRGSSKVEEFGLNSSMDSDFSHLRDVLARLPIAQGAAYNSYSNEHSPLCHPHTRTSVLGEISKWARSPQSESIYWLNGMAGTGKSTISRTLARSFAESNSLGATFFFKRGESDRGEMSKLFTTIASHLAQQLPKVAEYMKCVLDSDPEITSKNLRKQFEKLVIKPISQASTNSSSRLTYLIIIDALDECEREEDIGSLIRLLSSAKQLGISQLKFFLTSRPELPIRLGFLAVRGKFQDMILHEVEQSVIRSDIAAYLKDQLDSIREEFNRDTHEDQRLSTDWPSSADLASLVQMAVPLFIFAATISRFIADGRMGNPDEQLEQVLKYKTKSQESQLDATYLPVLHQMVAGLNQKSRERVLERFHVIIGSIVTLADPLNVPALAELLQLSRSSIHGALQTLHSVMNVPTTLHQPVQLLHLSFGDFLVDPKRQQDDFWINEKQAHQRLASHCMRVLSSSLRNDMCGVKDPGTWAASVSETRINACIPPEVQYACRFWAYHLEESSFGDIDMKRLWNFLSMHFLQWLETLSWLDRLEESKKMIGNLISRITSTDFPEITGFLHSASDFIRDVQVDISIYPLQVYSSALLFLPEESIIRNTFQQFTQSLSITIAAHEHTGGVDFVKFSPDGRKVVSMSNNRVIIWSVTTREVLAMFDFSEATSSVAFSPDSKQVAVTTADAVMIWSSDTGQRLFTHHNLAWFFSVTYSPDGKQVAVESCNRFSGELTVILWSVDTGEQRHVTKSEMISIPHFDSTSRRLHFKIGRIEDIPGDITPEAPSDSGSQSLGISPEFFCFWVTRSKQKLALLPFRYDIRCVSASDDNLVIGSQNGSLLFVQFVPELD